MRLKGVSLKSHLEFRDSFIHKECRGHLLLLIKTDIVIDRLRGLTDHKYLPIHQWVILHALERFLSGFTRIS
jgi:hypothetical protein